MGARTATRPLGERLNGHRAADGLPHLIDVATLAAHLGLTERTIRRKVAQGEIPHYKLDNSIRFDPVEIHAWLKTCWITADTCTTAGDQNGTRP